MIRFVDVEPAKAAPVKPTKSARVKAARKALVEPKPAKAGKGAKPKRKAKA